MDRVDSLPEWQTWWPGGGDGRGGCRGVGGHPPYPGSLSIRGWGVGDGGIGLGGWGIRGLEDWEIGVLGFGRHNNLSDWLGMGFCLLYTAY